MDTFPPTEPAADDTSTQDAEAASWGDAEATGVTPDAEASDEDDDDADTDDDDTPAEVDPGEGVVPDPDPVNAGPDSDEELAVAPGEEADGAEGPRKGKEGQPVPDADHVDAHIRDESRTAEAAGDTIAPTGAPAPTADA